MRKLTLLAMLMLAASMLIFCAGRSIAQEKDKHDKPLIQDNAQDKNQDMSGQMSKEDMEKMMAAGKPGPEHAELMKSAGDWDAECHFIMNGQPGPAMKGTMHIEPMFDGRYMLMKYEGVMNMGGGDMPYKGMEISGFDNITHKYFSIWIDSMNTSVMKSEGTREGNVLTLTGKMMDATMSKEVPFKEVITHDDDNHMTFQMFTTGPDGKEAEMMEIKYTRKM